MSRAAVTRAALLGALATGLLVVVVLLVTGGGAYQVRMRFTDAGQLVRGGLVEVGGRTIGKISEITLSDDNQAEVVVNITADEYRPLHRGTRASIRSVGLSGIANRFVDVSPGPAGAPDIPDGGVLSTDETKPIVDLDELLNALDERTRGRLRTLINAGARIYAGGTAETANESLRYLNPAAVQVGALTEELARDRPALEALLTAAADTSSALAERSHDVEATVTGTANTLRALAAERAALGDTIERAPAVLRQARGTFVRLRRSTAVLRPVLRETRPVAQPLAQVLRRLVPTGRQALPVVRQLRATIPPLERSLRGLAPLAQVALPAVRSTTSTLTRALPVVAGLRPYTADLIGGLVNGFGGTTATYYDANGHFVRISINGGSLSLPGLVGGQVPDLAARSGNVRTRLFQRCPGGAAEPAEDRSNPYVEDASTCKPEDDHR